MRGPGRASTDSGRSGGAGGAARPHYGQAGQAGGHAGLGGHRSPSLALACTCGHVASGPWLQNIVTQLDIVQSR